MSNVVKMNSEILQEKDENASKYLTFLLNDVSYAVSILKVKEIIEHGEVTPMPMMPDFICGTINLRGSAVPVIDLAKRLGLESEEVSRHTCFIIIELQTENGLMNLGVMVGAVSRVIDFKPEDIERTPSLGNNIRTDFIQAMGKIDEQFVIMLDIERVLSMEDVKYLSTVEETIS